MPVAEKVIDNPVPESAWNAWLARNGREYLLVNEKYSSALYITDGPSAGTLADGRAPGYVSKAIYKSGETGGKRMAPARITDENTALGYQSTPTMAGRDINNLYIDTIEGVEYLNVNNYRFVDASSAVKFSSLGDRVTVGSETVWADVDGLSSADRDGYGRIVGITAPPDGAWFVYDDKMACVATSLEKNPRSTIILPENGRLAFAGEPGAEFVLMK